MCQVDHYTNVGIKEAITKLVGRKKRFTGYDVYMAMASTACSATQISTRVRELFNTHDPVFANYACFPVPGGGPLLYFYAGSEVLAKGQAIIDSIRAAEATVDHLPKNW